MLPAISVVIPAFNEAVRIGDTLATTIAYLEKESPGSELIVTRGMEQVDPRRQRSESRGNRGPRRRSRSRDTRSSARAPVGVACDPSARSCARRGRADA